MKKCWIEHLKSKKKFIIDIFINMAGTGISLLILQLLINPILSRVIQAEQYGEMQTTMSIVYLLGGTFGGALSTTRLIREYEYSERGIKADFNLINLGCALLIVITVPFIELCYFHQINLIEICLTLFVCLLNYASNYYEVGLRLSLNYKAIFINKLLGCIGYFLGFFFFFIFRRWQFVYIGSLGLQSVYLIWKSRLFFESIRKSYLFPKTLHFFEGVWLSSLLSKALTYFDKVILYPMIGGAAVSIYFAANVFGKLIIQVLEPITNVILSYISKDRSVERKTWKRSLLTGSLFCIAMYFLCTFLSKPILGVFYPQWVNDAVQLLPYATAGLCLTALNNIIHPFVLKTINEKKLVFVNAVVLLCYIICAYVLLKIEGLVGCCQAMIICQLIKLLITVGFMTKETSKNV